MPTFSQIVANAPATKAVIPEVLNYLRYTAAIRALQYNCVFIHKAVRAKTDDDFKNLTSMSFDYKNSRLCNGIRCSNPRINISEAGFYSSALKILDESKQIIQTFEDILLLDKLSNVIPEFEKKMADTIRLKNHYTEYADKLTEALSKNKNILNGFVDHISNHSKHDVKAETVSK